MSAGPVVGYICALLVGVYLIYSIVSDATHGSFGSDFIFSVVGLVLVIVMPIAFTMHGKRTKAHRK